MELALFDLDGTLLAGDVDVEWSELLGEQGLVDPARIHAFLADYRRGELDVAAFYRFTLAPLAEQPLPRLLELRGRLLRERILPRIHPRARPLLARHAGRGHTCVLVSATNTFLAAPVAEALGLAHVLATVPERRGEGFTGGFLPPPCFREGKLAHVERWLAARGTRLSDLRASWCYGDSRNDLPLLERVTHAVAVAPDEELARVARERGWPRLD